MLNFQENFQTTSLEIESIYKVNINASENDEHLLGLGSNNEPLLAHQLAAATGSSESTGGAYISTDILPKQWAKWTGNKPISEEMKAYLKPTSSKTPILGGEMIKIPFKPIMWQSKIQQEANRAEHRRGDGHIAFQRHDGTQEHGYVEAAPNQTRPPSVALSAGAGASASGNVSVSALSTQLAAQLVYGEVRFKEPVPSPYWKGLSLTECLIASPFYQHLSADKFRALEHFTVLRPYKHGELILAVKQKFFNLFVVR